MLARGADRILRATPLDEFSSVLDVGMGDGSASEYFAAMGKRVAATETHIDMYGADADRLRDLGVYVVDARIEELPFADGSFDAVWISHVLEHVLDVGVALSEARRVLAPSGYLFVLVPPYQNKIGAGHLSIGWNLLQLMYVLLLCGFDAKHGRFVKHKYCVAGFVHRTEEPLPELCGGRGDIRALAHLFPLPVKTQQEDTVQEVNWTWPREEAH